MLLGILLHRRMVNITLLAPALAYCDRPLAALGVISTVTQLVPISLEVLTLGGCLNFGDMMILGLACTE